MEKTMQVGIDELIHDDRLIKEEKYVKAYYSPTLKLLGIVWQGNFTKEQYIELFESLIAFAEKNQVIGFYSDIRNQGIVSVEGRKHFEKHISPKAAALGIDKTGVVTDASPFKKYYLNMVIRVTGRPTKLCSKPEDALAYILS
ncbi:hypothetical protein E1176_07220 [Fulvivirga sp. RKSG066]|uniref:hypothetical protein n=1 Tax=Fulvivirga aurantia TaxID=2529383 RepID=UPI0012BC721C|nr:hypothetical protein [Fulvivirga aurantia]MTI20805.1 hypothetical protein [Fulvivirga aurantia]